MRKTRPLGHWKERYQALLSQVEKPGRYLGNELGAIRKQPNAVAVHFALAFPDVYEIAQSHPGLQILYDLLNRRADTYAERAYAPWIDMERELRRAQLPLVSLETFTPLSEFDIVGFTLQYELTYTNLLAMLELGGIPLHAAQRSAQNPLVIAGGPCAFNPEPLAEFLDAVLLGDGEEAIHDICDTYAQWDGRSRPELLQSLSRIRGVYVPAFFEPAYGSNGKLACIRPLRDDYTKVEKRILRDLNDVPLQRTFVVPSVEIVHDRPSLEVMRGCVKGCRFCQAGYIYRPLRERSPQRVLDQASEALKATGHDEVSLLSLSTGDYSCVNPVLTELMNRLTPENVAVSLPSTRVDALAPALLEQIKRVRKTGFTLAPEAGSQRLRDVIQKEYQEEELVAAAGQIFALGWRSLKLYFMLGLPSETEEDLLGIVDLCVKVAAAGGFKRQVIASVSTFVPKPHTPFQWAPQIPIAEVERRQALLRHELAKRRIKFRYHDARLSYLEGIFSRGDRRTAATLLRAYQLGCRFDGWNEQCRFDLWQQAIVESGIDAEDYLRRRTLDEALPWDHLGCGVDKSYLQRELAYAFERTLTPDCSVERCTYCGACDFKEVRNVDYHVAGAKGSEHRGATIAHWASDVVQSDEPDGWEPRGWHKIRGKEQREQPAAESSPAVALSGPALPIATSGSRDGQAAAALGNAEEWLHANGEGLLGGGISKSAPARARIRLYYRKEGLARFIGTVELTTLFYRAARRARLPIAFSQGHHPLPRFAFGPALPLGMESEAEVLEAFFTDGVEAETIKQQFNQQLGEGLEVTHASCVDLRSRSIASEIRAFVYAIDATELVQRHGRAAVQQRLADFESAPEFRLRKHAKGGERIINARPFVERLELAEADVVQLVINFGSTGSIKATDLIAALFDLPDAEKSTLRVRKLATLFADLPASHGAGAIPSGIYS